MLNEDYKEMLQILLEENVKFIVVGAYALGAYGFPRATGVAPRRIDIITTIDGVEFQSAYAKKLMVPVEELNIPVLSVEDFIKNKESTGRESLSLLH